MKIYETSIGQEMNCRDRDNYQPAVELQGQDINYQPVMETGIQSIHLIPILANFYLKKALQLK